jgi:hypothetical protein
VQALTFASLHAIHEVAGPARPSEAFARLQQQTQRLRELQQMDGQNRKLVPVESRTEPREDIRTRPIEEDQPPPPPELMLEFARFLKSRMHAGDSLAEAGKKAASVFDKIHDLLDKNPDPDSAQARALFEAFPEGPARRLGMALADAFPERPRLPGPAASSERQASPPAEPKPPGQPKSPPEPPKPPEAIPGAGTILPTGEKMVDTPRGPLPESVARKMGFAAPVDTSPSLEGKTPREKAQILEAEYRAQEKKLINSGMKPDAARRKLRKLADLLDQARVEAAQADAETRKRAEAEQPAPPPVEQSGPPAPDPATGIINPVETGIPGIRSGAVEIPAEQPKPVPEPGKSSRLEVPPPPSLGKNYDPETTQNLRDLAIFFTDIGTSNNENPNYVRDGMEGTRWVGAKDKNAYRPLSKQEYNHLATILRGEGLNVPLFSERELAQEVLTSQAKPEPPPKAKPSPDEIAEPAPPLVSKKKKAWTEIELEQLERMSPEQIEEQANKLLREAGYRGLDKEIPPDLNQAIDEAGIPKADARILKTILATQSLLEAGKRLGLSHEGARKKSHPSY